jgi:hypothetical protein
MRFLVEVQGEAAGILRLAGESARNSGTPALRYGTNELAGLVLDRAPGQLAVEGDPVLDVANRIRHHIDFAGLTSPATPSLRSAPLPAGHFIV